MLLLLLSNEGLIRAQILVSQIIAFLYKYDSPYVKFH